MAIVHMAVVRSLVAPPAGWWVLWSEGRGAILPVSRFLLTRRERGCVAWRGAVAQHCVMRFQKHAFVNSSKRRVTDRPTAVKNPCQTIYETSHGIFFYIIYLFLFQSTDLSEHSQAGRG